LCEVSHGILTVL